TVAKSGKELAGKRGEEMRFAKQNKGSGKNSQCREGRMQGNNRSTKVSLLLVILLCACALRLAAQPTNLPEAVINAHSVFLVNETGFAELQNTAVLELHKWGHFESTKSAFSRLSAISK